MLALAPLAVFYWRRGRTLAWSVAGAFIYIALFNLRYAVLDGLPYSLSAVRSPDDLITYSAVTSLVAFIIAWGATLLGGAILRRGAETTALPLTPAPLPAGEGESLPAPDRESLPSPIGGRAGDEGNSRRGKARPAFLKKPYAEPTLALTFVIVYALSLPVWWSFMLNGFVATWTLPDFASHFLALLSLLQILLVGVWGLVLTGISALIFRLQR